MQAGTILWHKSSRTHLTLQSRLQRVAYISLIVNELYLNITDLAIAYMFVYVCTRIRARIGGMCTSFVCVLKVRLYVYGVCIMYVYYYALTGVCRYVHR